MVNEFDIDLNQVCVDSQGPFTLRKGYFRRGESLEKDALSVTI